MERFKIGIIGLGNIGKSYAKFIKDGCIPNASLTAITCRNEEKERWVKEHIGDNVVCFKTAEALLDSNEIDGVIIATPHDTHPYYAKLAFDKDRHVLIEKPAGVLLSEVEEMNYKALESGKSFSIMFDRRLDPAYSALKKLLNEKMLGKIQRVNWITTIFRTQGYYDSDSWRGSWKGEGGGVLLNQSQHQLDLWQWLFGMPKKIRAFCHYGKYHSIEVEDEATLYMEYDEGFTGVFVTSTFEAPGTERLEVVGEYGKIVLEEHKLTIYKLEMPIGGFKEDTIGTMPEYKLKEQTYTTSSLRRAELIQNWVESVKEGSDLIAKGSEGINALLLTQSAYLSDYLQEWVTLPLSHSHYNQIIKQTYITK